MELEKDFRFEAAHFLPAVPEGHKCRRVHGHSFRGTLAVKGPIDPATGWVIDFGELKSALDPVVAALDHQLLNEVDGLPNPTSELLAVWIWNRLQGRLALLHRVTIDETCTSRCHYYGPRAPITSTGEGLRT